MNRAWKSDFEQRMKGFASGRTLQPGDIPVSIKIRVSSGCFHREHSPVAYEIIDNHVARIGKLASEFVFEEHESGPEILVYLAVTAAGVTLAKSIIDLITTIVKARFDGIRRGDRPSAPISLIIRRVESSGDFKEETVIECHSGDSIDSKTVETLLRNAASKLLHDEFSVGNQSPSKKRDKIRQEYGEEVDGVVSKIVERFESTGFAQVPGYNRFGFADRDESNVVVSREKGKNTKIPFNKIAESIQAVRKDSKVYSEGPSRLRKHGITHITSPLWALLHLLTLEELRA